MFCEECGTKLEPGIRFCENCGTPVPMENITTNPQNENTVKTENCISVFTSSNWQNLWKNENSSCQNETGIILTKSSNLCSQLSCSTEQLNQLIKNYAEDSRKRGVSYYFLDMDFNKVSHSASGSVINVIDTLSEICNICSPKYLFILGNEKVIDFQVWKNESQDSDEDVSSDFGYTVLDVTSPWKGLKYTFDSALRVGRLPTWNGEQFELFEIYFSKAKQFIGQILSVKPYGLSALVWENESNHNYSSIASNFVDVSPQVTQFNVDGRIPADSNLFLFNLHGSDSTKFWYGQDGNDYPEAFSPENMSRLSSPNFIGVEACYGAMYENGKTYATSNVLAALSNNTIALLGSSRIAYGTSNPPGSCADIVIGEFIKQIAKGATAGDAHIEGLKKITFGTMDDSDIKTLCEFALYGDPSACTRTVYSVKSSTFTKSTMGLTSKTGIRNSRINIAIPDIRYQVHLSLAIVDKKISEAINQHVWDKYPQMKGVEPKSYNVGNTRLLQSVYQNNKKQVVKIYYDSFGHIKKELSSK